MDFTGKVAVVTGGANGIGQAVAQSFAARGARGVLVVDRDVAAGEATVAAIRAAGGTALFTPADVTQAADVRAYVQLALDTWGAIDCFHNNAGIEGKIATTAEYDEAVFDAVMAVNVKGVFLGLRHVLPVMLKQGRGAVVNTASVAGIFGTPGMPAYVASKHAVMGLTKVAAGEVGPQGIRVNAVCPGPVDTPIISGINDLQGVREAWDARVPMGRFARPEEIAAVVAFLASDDASYMTGAILAVDGGVTAHTGQPDLPRMLGLA
jgi:NAD(P)-dependent dehydrogenase (short-subunit alcohol dehydrogenase family)